MRSEDHFGRKEMTLANRLVSTEDALLFHGNKMETKTYVKLCNMFGEIEIQKNSVSPGKKLLKCTNDVSHSAIFSQNHRSTVFHICYFKKKTKNDTREIKKTTNTFSYNIPIKILFESMKSMKANNRIVGN